MSLPISLPIQVNIIDADSHSSFSESATHRDSEHPSVYVPLHKRRGIPPSALPSISHSALLVPGSGLHSGYASASASSSRSASPSPGLSSGSDSDHEHEHDHPYDISLLTPSPGIYTRPALLLLASSPLSHAHPAPSALYDQFPFILSHDGEQIHRALQFAQEPLSSSSSYNGNKKGRRGRPAKANKSKGDKKEDGEQSANGSGKGGNMGGIGKKMTMTKKQQMDAFFAKGSRSGSKGRSGSDSEHW